MRPSFIALIEATKESKRGRIAGGLVGGLGGMHLGGYIGERVGEDRVPYPKKRYKVARAVALDRSLRRHVVPVRVPHVSRWKGSFAKKAKKSRIAGGVIGGLALGAGLGTAGYTIGKAVDKRNK